MKHLIDKREWLILKGGLSRLNYESTVFITKALRFEAHVTIQYSVSVVISSMILVTVTTDGWLARV